MAPKAIVLMAALVLATSVLADRPTTEGDTLMRLHEMDQSEISAAKIAVKRGQSEPVQRYAKTLITDHESADRKVMDLAHAENVNFAAIGTEVEKQSSKDAAVRSRLENAPSMRFDTIFVGEMANSHAAGIATLKRAQRVLPGSKTAALIAELLPVWKAHEQTALAINRARVAE